MSDFESRLRSLENRAALQDLIVRYFLASDDDDYLTLASQFSAKATFNAGGQTVADSCDAVIAFLREARKSMGLTIHTPDYSLFDFQDDDHATGLVGAHLELAIVGKSLFGAVRYNDRYVRHDGRWLFEARTFQVIHIGPWEEIGRSLTEPLRVRWPGVEPKPSEVGDHK